ncbi:MAG: T9SS type A sorting domain-containing protein, partial [Saprospiraceae bacterium]
FEKEDGSFQFLRRMENKNSNIYAFLPLYITLTNSNDFVVSFRVVVDSVLESFTRKLEFGGWCFIAKINSSELGLTNTSEVISAAYPITVFPNPSNGEITISGLEPDSRYHYELRSINGIIMDTGLISSDQVKLSVQNYTSGAYILKMIDVISGSVRIVQIIKQE